MATKGLAGLSKISRIVVVSRRRFGPAALGTSVGGTMIDA